MESIAKLRRYVCVIELRSVMIDDLHNYNQRGINGVVDSLRQLFQRGDYNGVVQRAEQHLKRRRSGEGASPRDDLSLIVEAALIGALTHLSRGAGAEGRFEVLAQLPEAEKSRIFSLTHVHILPGQCW